MSGLFNLPARATRAGDSKLVTKAQNKASPQTAGINIKGGGGLLERISTITALVNSKLGHYKDKYIVIRDIKELEEYIDKCIENDIISIDTETNSLDPITCDLAGICIYTPGLQAAYIPMNHVSYITGMKSNNQLGKEEVKKQFERVRDNQLDVIMFNAKFDIRVLTNQLEVKLKPSWDGYIAARLLNENEPVNNLKALHQKYCMKGEGDAFTFDSLFRGIPFTHVPINTGYLYAARDAEVTYELYEFQKPFLTEGDPICIERDLEGVASVYNHIELPLIQVVADMEDTGVEFDFNLADSLSMEYTAKLEQLETNFNDICDTFKDDLDSYRQGMGNNNKLQHPINIGSPQQLAILLYDVLKIESPDKKSPRGTGVAIMEKIDHPVSKAILEYRGVAKLLSTYIDKLPNIVNERTGRIHASFNQIGADTGRFSSSDPNLQNIPSRNSEIRKMFKATDGYLMVSSDYSAQEPRITAHMSKDEKMIQAYKEGKDLYVEIASIAFNLPYDDCKEFKDDGTRSSEGKQRREISKAIVLGVCYGKGVPAIASDLGISVKEGQEIYDKIMRSFPGLPAFMQESERMAIELGYVDTVWGRKRRLPNMQLPQYEFKYIGGVPTNFDPLNFDQEINTEVDEVTKQKYINQMNRAYGGFQKKQIRDKAKEEGIEIKDNGGYIAEATRQTVNSRIQGSAADETKKAMILVGNDAQLKELGFRLLIPVHDELIGESPKENAVAAGKRLSELMVEAAKDLNVPSVCDIEITDRWFGEPLQFDE